MITFAQYGEDAILEGVIERLEWVTGDEFQKKTYIDIGGFHPEIHSIFYHFYKERGWRGSVYEPNTIHNGDFFRIRPFDNLHNYAVAGSAGFRKFLIFSDGDSSNTINQNFASRKEKAQGTSVTSQKDVVCITLKDAIRLHEQAFGETALVISIDAEGSDFEIIANYDFTTRPLFFFIEDEPGQCGRQTPLNEQMLWHGYRPVAATVMTTLFMDTQTPYFEALGKMGQR